MLKQEKTSKTDSDICRPVMNSSIFLKLLEYFVLFVLKNKLTLTSRQFGFCPGTNCHSAVMMLQGVMQSYTELDSKVHFTLLDLTPFDRMNFNIPIAKLKQIHLPMQVVKLLAFLLINSFAILNYNDFKANW